ncbi:hypothetical protein ABZ901_10870 [Actinacidiphila alni]|uniref:hypothetical protein n=1 Tax=Actinacidiphila alni TaxID=380248 RepID=UPI0033FFBC3F
MSGRPVLLFTVPELVGTNVDSLCNTLTFPAVVAGALLVLFGFGRLVVANATQ